MGGKDGRGEQEEEKWENINVLVQLVTEFPTKYCMVAYECNV